MVCLRILYIFFLGRPDPPKDIRIDVIGTIAKVSWIIPSYQGVSWSRIYLHDSKGGSVHDLYSGKRSERKHIKFPTSSFEIGNLKKCSEYTVEIQCIRGSQHSDITTQKFWMTGELLFPEIVHFFFLLPIQYLKMHYFVLTILWPKHL